MVTTKNKNPVIIISGATATGKTSTSLNLARSIDNIEVINFDSLLFFKELNIGTAKPTVSEMQAAPHHLVGVMSIHEEMNASKFVEEATSIISRIHQQGKVPLLVGGSAFYIRALIKGMYEAPRISDSARTQVEELLREEGPTALRAKLKSVDLSSYNSIHQNDLYRSSRALEYYLSTSQKFSDQKQQFDHHDPYDFSKNPHPKWEILHLYLSIPKEDHWDIILKRTQKMINDGLLQEVTELIDQLPLPYPKPLQSIGYKECIQYQTSQKTDGPMSIEDLIELIFISTRRLAKSQKTFFNKITPKNTYHPIDEETDIISKTKEFISKF